jgi:hypothetical protein
MKRTKAEWLGMSPIKKFDTVHTLSSTDIIARNFLKKISANGPTPQNRASTHFKPRTGAQRFLGR